MPRYETRHPAVAGSFYEDSPSSLVQQIENCFLHPLGPGKLPEDHPPLPRSIVGAVSPHAGYMFSGPPAARVYYELAKEAPPEVVVIIGTKHTWEGPDISVWSGGDWTTPLGEVRVHREIIDHLTRECPLFQLDASAHYGEHAEEVQLPFLQHIYRDSMPAIVPISYGLRPGKQVIESGRELADLLRDKSALIIASTDFSHYEPQEVAQRKDRLALDKIEGMNAAGLLKVVAENNISMCGCAATAAALEACKHLGATRVEILGYSTSGDILQGPASVVGYGAAVIRKVADSN